MKHLLQQWRSGRGLPLVINHARSRAFTQSAHFLQNRRQATLTMGPEACFVGPDGKVQHGDGCVFLHREELEVAVVHLDLQHPREGADGGLGEGAEVPVFPLVTGLFD